MFAPVNVIVASLPYSLLSHVARDLLVMFCSVTLIAFVSAPQIKGFVRVFERFAWRSDKPVV